MITFRCVVIMQSNGVNVMEGTQEEVRQFLTVNWERISVINIDNLGCNHDGHDSRDCSA